MSCDRCPRLRDYCRRVAQDKKRAHRNDTYWGRPVPGFGDPDARLLLIALAPAAHGANRTGRVFTGDGAGGSGDFLMAALHRAGFASIPTSTDVDDGLQLYDAFISAAVRCAPPDNTPLPEEITRCLDHVDAEAAELPRVEVAVALGKIAFDVWVRRLRRRGLAMSPRPHFGHGVVVRLDVDAARAAGVPPTLIGCYHPSRQNTNTGKLTPPMMDEVFVEARRLIEGSGTGDDELVLGRERR